MKKEKEWLTEFLQKDIVENEFLISSFRIPIKRKIRARLAELEKEQWT
jgi:hypothetical protein